MEKNNKYHLFSTKEILGQYTSAIPVDLCKRISDRLSKFQKRINWRAVSCYMSIVLKCYKNTYPYVVYSEKCSLQKYLGVNKQRWCEMVKLFQKAGLIKVFRNSKISVVYVLTDIYGESGIVDKLVNSMMKIKARIPHMKLTHWKYLYHLWEDFQSRYRLQFPEKEIIQPLAYLTNSQYLEFVQIVKSKASKEKFYEDFYHSVLEKIPTKDK